MKKLFYVFSIIFSVILFFGFLISKPVDAADLTNASLSAPTGLTASFVLDRQVTPTWTAVTTKGQFPGSIKRLKVSNVTLSTVDLAWKAVDGATGYKIYRSDTSNGSFIYVGTSTTESYLDEGLAAGTKYYYEVSAVNDNGEGTKSRSVSAITKGTLPGTVADLSISTISADQVSLTWSAVSDAKSYKIYRSAEETGPFKYVRTCRTTVYLNKGLKPSTTYYYYVTAVNKTGEGSQSTVVPVITKGEVPGKIKELKAVSNDSSVDLTWKAADGAVSYIIYRSGNRNGEFASIGTSTTESYSDAAVTSNTKYYYKVSAVNENGEGKLSNIVVVTAKGGSSSVPTNYTALGDSIAYGLSASSGKGYVDLFYNYLKGLTGNADMESDNLAVCGYTSSDLLSQLQGDSKTQQAISESKIVTVCIGGNNLLQPTIGAVAAAFSLNPNDSNFTAELEAKLSDPANVKILYNVLTSEDFVKTLTSGVIQFSTDWSQIVATLKKLAPDAQIYAMTIYNPFNGGDLFNLFDPYIKEINTTIMSSEKENNFNVADVYSVFLSSQEDDLTGINSMDPHPTDKGHELIYQAHVDAGLVG